MSSTLCRFNVSNSTSVTARYSAYSWMDDSTTNVDSAGRKLLPMTGHTMTANPVPIKLEAMACDPDFPVISAKLSMRTNELLMAARVADDAKHDTFLPMFATEPNSRKS